MIISKRTLSWIFAMLFCETVLLFILDDLILALLVLFFGISIVGGFTSFLINNVKKRKVWQ